MTEGADNESLRARISRGGEDTLGRLAQELLESPLVNSAISRAFEARERAAQAQEVAMGALNLPSAGDLERLTRRVRSVSQRLEGVEDVLDRVEQQLDAGGGAAAIERRLAAIEEQLRVLTARLDRQPAPAPAVARRAPAPSRTRANAARRRAARSTAARAARAT